MLYLIEILHQTTTLKHQTWKHPQLYLIEILHQTTTDLGFVWLAKGLYLIEILHQTTTPREILVLTIRCILSKFYIKPQLSHTLGPDRRVVSYRNSTSNHNPVSPGVFSPVVVSYRNSTSNHNFNSIPLDAIAVVSYRNSTSNHNC